MIFAALLIHGVQPSPSLISERPDVFWGVVASMYIGNVMLLFLNLPLVGMWVQLLKVRYAILAPVICVICLLGVYSFQSSFFDVWVMLLFGVIGYLMRKLDFESGPLILAFVLGPIFELSVRQSFKLSGGSPGIFVTRPISAVLLAAAVLVIIGYFSIAARRKRRPRRLKNKRGLDRLKNSEGCQKAVREGIAYAKTRSKTGIGEEKELNGDSGWRLLQEKVCHPLHFKRRRIMDGYSESGLAILHSELGSRLDFNRSTFLVRESGETSLILWNPAVSVLVSPSANCGRSFSQCLPNGPDQPMDGPFS